MAPISLRIITNEGAATRKVKFDSKISVRDAHAIVKEKVIVSDPSKEHGLFLRSPDNDRAGIWLEQHRTLDYYMLRDGDSLEYICKRRNLRVKLLDGSVKTLPVDEGKTVSELMVSICGRLNITNYDEYGLCPEEDETKTEEVPLQPQTGTLTLKRPKVPHKERDLALEQLSKKFNTDDNVHWLDQHSTLRELGVEPSDTVILKRRLFFSDRNVDARDPVQLNLLYVQTRDAILNGRHLVTEDQAVEFAGIQCQIHYDDFQEEKHKPGFIENLNEFLPETYASSWGIERKLLKAHRKHHGLSPLEAKHLYIKTARELPTYGVTFFLVKEKQKGKKKLVPRLLGINAEAILRMDENTKEILQQWPLTHVKSYHVGKSETFALNFGDYSDKEYCCKTQDAFRIRDILEGYIDIIRRRMFARPSGDGGDSMAICHDNVQSGQMQIIQHVQNQPSKLVKESFIGPNRIVPFDQGSSAQQGTQMMTMQQIIQTNQFNNPQRALKGEVAQRGQLSADCVRTLKRMNSCSVKAVTLLADPTEENISETQELTKNMQDNLGVVEKGVKEIVKEQTIEESQQLLLNEMQDLTNYVNKLSDAIKPGHVNTIEAKDAAEKIVDVTTSMYCAQDSGIRRRSELLNRSKKSFRAGEEMDASIRRASFLVAADGALGTTTHAEKAIAEEYKGPQLDEARVRRAELALQDRLGKLNAALALYLTAHSDPNNIDYSAAITSMNTIKELMPELALEGQMLASSKDHAARKELVDDMQTLFEDTRKLCSLTGTEDHEKMQEASNKYADIANKLLFRFARGRNAEKENEIIELARQAGEKTSLLLMSANELTSQVPASSAAALDAAGVRSAGAARDLLACAQLTAPAITEPHCQSALTAAAEGLSSSVHQLSATWKPLVEEPSRQQLEEQLHQRELDVHTALERLQDAYANLSGAEDESLPIGERQRLKFICSLSGARNNLKNLPSTWGTSGGESPMGAPTGGMKNPALPELKEKAARRRLAEQLAQLNGAVARLVRATSDPEKPDYETAESALNTIADLMPTIVHDADVVSARQDEPTRAAVKQYVTGLCDANQHLFDDLDRLDDLGPSAAKFSASCSKLKFLISPGADKGREEKINELAAAAHDNSCALLAHAQAGGAGGAGGRAQRAASALVAVAQVTAPTIDEPSCSNALASALQHLLDCINDAAAASYPPIQPGSKEDEALQNSYQKLKNNLEEIAKIAGIDLIKDVEMSEASQPDAATAAQKERKRLQFINGMTDAKKRLDAAEQQMKEPLACVMMRAEDGAALQQQLGASLARLQAAGAALARATADRENPDYEAAQRAVDTITQLMPEFVQETCVLGATKSGETQNNLLQHLQQLCDASRAICDSAGQPENINEAAAKFSDANKKLLFLLSPGASRDKEKEIMDLSSDACVRASDLLSRVQALTQKIPGDEGAELDRRGAKTADAAQALLTTAQETAPTIASPQCSAALISAAEELRSSAKDLTTTCQPHLKPGHQEQLELQQSEEQLENSLNKLVQACKETPRRKPPSPPSQDKQRLHFKRSLSGAKSCFDDAQQQLQEPVICALMREEDAQVLQHQLSDKLAQLNAAIAALATATADREHPDYASAQRAVNTITALMPELVRDSKTLSGTKAGDAQKDMLQQVQLLCDATKAICDNAEKPQALSEAAAKFSDASGKLMFTISPASDNLKEKQIIDLSSDACVRASDLLSRVQALTQKIPGDEGAELDRRGAKTADAAQALLTTAQVTAPSITSPNCSAALVSATEQLRSSAKELTNSCQPHLKPGDREQIKLQKSEQQLEDSLNNLLQACKETPRHKPSLPPKQDKQRLQFIASLSGTKSCFDDVQQQLQRPVICALMREEDAQFLQHQLSDKLAQLNAAIAALATATADREHPDYASAQRAVNTITALMPELVRDSKTLSGTKVGDAQKDMLHQVQQLCDASRAICDNVEQPQALSEAAAKFSDASGKLMFTISPAPDNLKEKQIMDLSSDACVRASDLLSRVQALTQKIPGDEGAELDRKGAKTADAAQALLTTAQVVAPSITSPNCSAALVSATEQLRSSAKELMNSCQPHLKPGDKEQLELQKSEQQLEDSLNDLLQACKETPQHKPSVPPKQDKQRLQFIASLSETKSCFDDVQQQLQRPVICALMREEDAQVLQHQLSDKLAQLNAAIAALATATADREHPDYASAQRAVNTITALMPELVRDSRTLCGTKAGDPQHDMLQQVQQLCDASRAICDNAGQPQALSEAAAKFSNASGKLMFTISPASDTLKKKQIMDLSSDACVRTSELLSQVQALTQKIPAEEGAKLDNKGARTADAAQALLTTAQVTAPSIASPHCSAALVSAAERLRSSAKDLTSSCTPYLKSRHQQQLELHESEKQLVDSLDKLVQASKDTQRRKAPPPPQPDKQRIHFMNSLSGAKSCFHDAQQQLKKPIVCSLMREEDGVVLQHQLSDRLAQLNAAVAALATATADREHPDYASAQRAVNTITALMPELVRDSRTLCGTKAGDAQYDMLQQVQQLCDASRAICDNAGQPQAFSAAAAKFSDASGKLMFTISSAPDKLKEKQIMDLSSDACVRTSELLSQVQALTQKIPAEVGVELDKKGARTADAAQALLTTAQVTAPSIASPHCSAALVSAAERLRSSANDLTSSCTPYLKSEDQKQLELQNLEVSLDKLVQATKETQRCKPPPPPQPDKERMHFMNSLSGAKSCFDDVQQQLKQPIVCALMREEDGALIQHQLSDRLAQLNATIAALTTATADREHPDYASAQRAVNTITALMPELVRDVRTFSATKNGPEQHNMLQNVQQLCEASKAICDKAGQPQGVSDAAMKFSEAFNKLLCNVTPRRAASRQTRQQQVIDLSAASCARASELLSQVQALTQQVGGSAAMDLDRRGAKTADAAQALLNVTHLTAPNVSSPQCRAALESSVQKLRGSAADLTDACGPHIKEGAQRQELLDTHQLLNDDLDLLLQANGIPLSREQQEKQRLHFMNSLSGAKICFDDVKQQLKQPVVHATLHQEEENTIRRQLADRLAQLNAAIAKLTVSTSDREHPDFASAQRAVNTITALMPELVRDAKTLSATKDEPAQQHELHHVQQLCDASRALCENIDKPQELSKAAIQFSEASSNMISSVHPVADRGREKQIIDLSALSCSHTSDLLSQVQALTKQLHGDIAVDLDSQGASTADAAQTLLAVAQVTAPSISSPHCQKVLQSAAEKLRESAAELAASCDPHVKTSAQRQELRDNHQQLEDSLDMLLHASGRAGPVPPALQEKMRVKFIRCVSTFTPLMEEVEKQRKEPLICAPMKPADAASLQHQLGRHLAQLNVAIAALAAATNDHKNPDYPAAERSIITINELMPKVVQESKKLSCSKDDDSQRVIEQNLKELCDASRRICDNADNPMKLNESAVKFADASSRLMAVAISGDGQLDSSDAKRKGPAVPQRSPPPAPSTKPVAHAVQPRHSCTTQHFLDALRTEEDNDNAARIVAAERKRGLTSQTDEQKYQLQQFSQAVDAAENEIGVVENSLKALRNTKGTCDIDPLEVIKKEQKIEDALARAGIEVAALVSANYADKLDYSAAQKPTLGLGNSVRSIVEDGSKISGALPQEVRKTFINDMSGLCAAARNICRAARDDKEKLNDSAIAFGNQSAKLLHVVSANVNPALEKEVILRARAIGDSASRLALEATNFANSTAPGAGEGERSPEHDICTAGAQCVDAAGKLVYTAKLMAPTIHHKTCKETLASSADSLASKLATFTDTWQPLASDPHTEKLTEESRNLAKLLEKLKADVQRGRLGKRRDVDRLVVVDTPLRQMTVQIIDNARNMAEHGDLTPDAKQEYKNYSGRLTEALRALDLANARCQRAPHDKHRRDEMEIAIQDLQMMVLQTRPSRAGQEQNNIVDFRDFLQGLVTESDNLVKAADKNQSTIGKRIADDIKLLCSKISEDSTKLMNPTQHAGYDSFEDIMDIYEFGQECDHLAKELTSMIKNIPDAKARNALHAKLFPVAENCNLLRFATNSALSTAKSAAYESTLQDLDDFQTTIIKVIGTQRRQREREQQRAQQQCPWRVARAERSVLRAGAGAGAGAEPRSLRHALASLCLSARTRARTDETDSDSDELDGISGLADGLQHHTVLGSLHSANWMHPEVSGDTDPVLQEINKVGSSLKKKPKIEVLKDEDIEKLLSTQSHKVEGTRNQLEEKFQQLSTKLSSMSGSIFLSMKKPESVARSLHATADAAAQLANTARGLKDEKKPVQSKKIEDATREMCFATYDLLKTSEALSQNPDHHDTRRRLLEPCYHLNDSINKLNRAIYPEVKLSRDCNELLRVLQLQKSLLQSTPQPAASSPYSHCIDALHSQRDLLLKLNSDQAMSRDEFLKSMLFITTAVTNSTECAAQATYLLSVSEKDKTIATEGIVDVPKIKKNIAAIHDTCVSVILDPVDQVKEEKRVLEKQIDELMKDLDESVERTKGEDLKKMLKEHKKDIELSAQSLYKVINENKPADVVISHALGLDDDIGQLSAALENPALVPTAGQLSQHTQTLCEDVLKQSTALVSNTQELIKEIKSSPEQSEVLKWTSFSKRRDVLSAFDALLKSIKSSGQSVNIVEADEDASEQKSYVQIQTDTAFKWLHKPMAKSDVKANGQQAVKNLIDIGKKMTEDLSGADKEDMRHVVEETEQLLTHCSKKYDQDQYSLLMERIRELKKAIERMAVTRVVEDFMDAEEPLADLDILADAERDEKSRNFLLERKIAELLAQLARVSRTARLIADTGSAGPTVSTQLRTCSEQTELLAPMLVKAAQERVHKPDDKTVIENYKALLARYTESLSKVRDLCDQSVDTMDFVQTAGETMQRMREDSINEDPMKCALISAAITKLANRVILVSLASSSARADPELQRALGEAQRQLSAATPAPDTRASKMPDWKDTTAKILHATGKVESVLGGEAIFNKEPDTNQPIYNEALNLHVAIRDWSSRDNEIVAVAKRMAVLMAKLSAYMNADKQHEVLTTSKSIVVESHEVARLAKKLAHECSDHRIKTNLLQVCERIPTISGQLKMLTTIKGSCLGHQGTQEDKEAMDMLVGNAQSLMISIQDVVKAAASASVKIMSQRGPRIKWVRKTYY